MCIGERRFLHTENPKDRSKAEYEILVRREFGYDQNLARTNKAYYKADSWFIERAFYSGLFHNK
jgi:hypothetical protein